MGIPISVRCDALFAEQVRARVKAAARGETFWHAHQTLLLHDTAKKKKWTSEQVSAARARNKARRLELRAAGILRGTIGAWVQPTVIEIMDRAGWLDRECPPVPDLARNRGRQWGSYDKHLGDKQLKVELPGLPASAGRPDLVGDGLMTRLIAACWWESWDAIKALMDWYDEHGDSKRGIEYGGRLGRLSDWGPSPTALRERRGITYDVINHADVLRLALEHQLRVVDVGG